ncbi:MAG: molybdopterin cofactor-binding domain-containing protein [Verrucomicrobiota bacterium]
MRKSAESVSPSGLVPENGDLTVLVVGSPHARAEVRSLQVAASRAVRGVRTVLTDKDFQADVAGMPPLTTEGEVRFEGQPVVAIVADGHGAALEGREALRVEYARLPAVLDMEEASRLKSYHGDPVTFSEGKVGSTLDENGDLVVLSGRVSLSSPPRSGEMIPVRAVPEGNGGVSVRVETWLAGNMQRQLAKWLGLPLAKVTVMPGESLPSTPGSDDFGLAQHAAIAAAAALRTGRSVTLNYQPTGESLQEGSPILQADYRVGYLPKEGKIQALEVSVVVDGGPWAEDAVEALLMDGLLSVYDFAAVDFSVRCASTNTPPMRSIREEDIALGTFLAEEILSDVARESGTLGEVLRQRNFAGELTDANPLVSVWRGGLRSSDYATLRKEGESSNEESRYSKRGLAAIPVRCSQTEKDDRGVKACEVRLQLHGDGSLRTTIPLCEEGLRREMRGRASNAIGVDRDDVFFESASNSDAVSGPALKKTAMLAFEEALQRLAKMLRPYAAEVFEQSGIEGLGTDDVEFMAGRIFSRANPDVGFSYGEFATYLDERLVAPVATASLYGKSRREDVFGVGISEVRLDGFTGDFKILRARLFVGAPEHKVDFPAMQRRLKAGFLLALRWLMCSQEMPLEMEDVPLIFEVETVDGDGVSAPSPGDCFAFGQSFACSVREALRHAMVAARPEGNPGDLGLPMTPESVFRAMQRKG